MKRKTAIIYHEIKTGVPCPDGTAAAWVAAKKYPDAEIVGCTYQGETLPEKLQDLLYEQAIGEIELHLVIVDFSFPKTQVDNWEAKGICLTICDHHQTAFEQLADFNLGTKVIFNFDLKECGATLTWQLFFPDRPMPAFLEFIRDRDLWEFKLAETPIVHAAMGKLGRTFELFNQLEPMTKEQLIDFLRPIGEPLVKERRRKVEAIASRFEWREIDCYRVPFIRLTKYEEYLTSDVCQYLYKQISAAPFVVALMSDGVSYSLRSDKDGNNFDVASIASQFGGGGHRNAAGFKSQQKVFK